MSDENDDTKETIEGVLEEVDSDLQKIPKVVPHNKLSEEERDARPPGHKHRYAHPLPPLVERIRRKTGISTKKNKMRQNGIGPPPEDLVNKICKSIESGLPVPHACRLAGRTPNAYSEWRRKARAGIPAYIEIIEKIDYSKSKLHLDLIKPMHALATKGIPSKKGIPGLPMSESAAKFFLTSSFPEIYNEKLSKWTQEFVDGLINVFDREFDSGRINAKEYEKILTIVDDYRLNRIQEEETSSETIQGGFRIRLLESGTGNNSGTPLQGELEATVEEEGDDSVSQGEVQTPPNVSEDGGDI